LGGILKGIKNEDMNGPSTTCFAPYSNTFRWEIVQSNTRSKAKALVPLVCCRNERKKKKEKKKEKERKSIEVSKEVQSTSDIHD